jgi:Rha family phage regulatory protein
VDQNLVIARDGHVFASSRDVAERFGKRHADVLRGIDQLVGQATELAQRNFASGSYLDANGQSRPEQLMDRDGFMLLAMGFTGKAALRWKLRYIEAFNAMEAKLREPAPAAIDMNDPAVLRQLLLTQVDQTLALQSQVATLSTQLQLGQFRRPQVDPTRLVLRMIRSMDVIPRGALSRKVGGRFSPEVIDAAVDTLAERGEIEVIRGTTNPRYGGRPGTWYVAL